MRRKPNERLIKARLARGWSLEAVAIKMGSTAKRVKAIENGTGLASPTEQEQLCAVFGLNIETLGFLKENKKRQMKRAAFLQEKRENASLTDKLLESGGGSATIMNVHNRKGGRARKVRRG